jgi:hypothetical protein
MGVKDIRREVWTGLFWLGEKNSVRHFRNGREIKDFNDIR